MAMYKIFRSWFPAKEYSCLTCGYPARGYFIGTTSFDLMPFSNYCSKECAEIGILTENYEK